MADGYEGPERRMSRHQSTDEGRLAELGYKQELKRDWSMLHNFGVSFSIIVCYLSFKLSLAPILTYLPVRHHWNNHPLRIRSTHWRPWRHVRGMDRRVLLHHVRRSRHGRDCLRHPLRRRALLLVCHPRTQETCTACILGNRLV